MNLTALTKAVATESQSDRMEVDISLRVMLTLMRRQLRAGEEITLRGFGKFIPLRQKGKVVGVEFVAASVLVPVAP